MLYGLDLKTEVKWTENSLNSQSQGVVTGGAESRISTGLSCNLDDVDDMADCNLSQSADGTKLGEVADILEGHAAIQRDFDRLNKLANKKSMKLNKEKYNILHLLRNNSRPKYKLGGDQLERSFAEKDLRIPVDKSWTVDSSVSFLMVSWGGLGEHCQQAKGGDTFPLLRISEAFTWSAASASGFLFEKTWVYWWESNEGP